MMKDRELTPEEWHQERWTEKDKDPTFHRKKVSDSLVKYQARLIAGGKSRVFFPLCGKTLDMVHLAEQNCEVVGLEFSPNAIICFFEENGLSYTEEKLAEAPFVKYCANEKHITIFQGDLFEMEPTICGEFDAIFDRGGYVAINVSMRQNYANLMASILKPKGKILMEAIRYDANYGGPPHSVSLEDLEANFTKFDMETLERYQYPAPPHFKIDGMIFDIRIALFERK